MRHLKPRELTELLEGQLPAARAAHADECERCRDEANALRDVWQRASAVDIPEPSPLYWDHFASRVRDAIETTSAPAGGTPWVRRPAAAWTASALLATLVLALAFGRALVAPIATLAPQGESSVASDTSARLTDADPIATSPLEGDVEADAAWTLVRIVADEVSWDDPENMGFDEAPGNIERLALELNATERIELARLVEDELKRNGA